MADNANIKLTVEAWAEIVIKEWMNMVERLNIHNPGTLVNSFEKFIHTNSGGDPSRILFAFEWYGKFVDMGVGRYVSLDIRDALINAGAIKRRPKPWFTDVFYKQLEVLRHLLEEKYAMKTELYITRNLEDNSDLGFNETIL